MSDINDTVSPSGKSIVESVISGEEDPTVEVFNKNRQDIANSIKDFFSLFGKPCIQGIPYISQIPCWVLIIVLIVALIGIVKVWKW
jgi:hypothetical protein